MKTKKYKQQSEAQQGRAKIKISLFSKRETTIKLLEYPSISAAKVATFNEWSNVFKVYFATI